MTYRVVVLPKADRQLDMIDVWWRAHRLASPDLFMTEFERARARLAIFPDSGRRYGLARFVMLPVTRYLLYYAVDDAKAVVRILAIRSAHHGPIARL